MSRYTIASFVRQRPVIGRGDEIPCRSPCRAHRGAVQPADLLPLTAQGSETGLQRHGGRPFGYGGFTCGTEERVGTMRTWSDCRIQRRLDDGRDAEMRFFGGIIEREGMYKFLSYASDY